MDDRDEQHRDDHPDDPAKPDRPPEPERAVEPPRPIEPPRRDERPPTAGGSGLDWRQVSRGLTWIGIGTLLLLNTTGQLRWSFWVDALFYWPVLLVALGLRLIFDRSRAPWAVLASPVLILGTLAWVAAGEGPGARADWTALQAPLPDGARGWTLDADLAGAVLDVRAGPVPGGMLVVGRAASPRDPYLRLSQRGSPRVRLGRRDDYWELSLPWRRERWELDVTPQLPISVELEGAASGGTLDLHRAPVERVRLEGAANGFRLILGKPRRDVRIDVEGAFNMLDLTVPEDVPVEIRKDGFLNIHRGRGEDVRGGPGYRIVVDGAFNRLKVRSGR